MPYLVTLGDSVPWGQGLLPEHKFSRLVADELRQTDPSLIEHLLAHSGAVIGLGHTVTAARVHGEVPVGPPTIVEQVGGFPGEPADVPVVLVNGGINDVDIRNILNPFIRLDALHRMTIEHCYDSMRRLLEITLQRFSDPRTAVFVTGYYPILSRDSQPFRVPRLLLLHGLQAEPPPAMMVSSFFDLVVERCLLFWTESTLALQQAVDEVNRETSDPRVVFVDPGYTEENAVFASDPWLWGLNSDFTPQDEVVAERRGACNAAIPGHDGLAREQCYRASAGHPNVAGARKYADAIFHAMS
ncbi:MAG TPA: hypothetical protein VMO26_09310 [Vicinamibacterales bacterium]|nr:hypothetical protein [Vicinamibacterales bacterium]